MRVLGKNKLLKIKNKNIGNKKLSQEIDTLITDLENFNPKNQKINDIRKDADCVHSEGFYFFNLNIHRTLVMMEFEEDGDATIIWVGTHQEYEKTFKNNKNTIEKWLRNKDFIN